MFSKNNIYAYIYIYIYIYYEISCMSKSDDLKHTNLKGFLIYSLSWSVAKKLTLKLTVWRAVPSNVSIRKVSDGVDLKWLN